MRYSPGDTSSPHLKPACRLGVVDAAAYAGVSSSFLNKLRVRGGGQDAVGPVFMKLGRRVVYDVRDLDEWLAASRRRSTSEAGLTTAAGSRSRVGGR